MRAKCLTVAAVGACFATLAAADATGWKPELMDKTTEIEDALAAGPPSIRDGAGIYVLTAGGYELARESSNGFHCLVGRSQPGSFEPQCLDAEGSKTLLEQILLHGSLQMQGLARDEIRQKMDAAWESGALEAPSRPGINYMLSEKNMVPIGPDRVIPYGPHLMFYAPNLTNADIGGDRTGRASPIFMINEGKPSGYVIVPVADHGGDG